MSQPQYTYHVSAHDRVTGKPLAVGSIKPVDGAVYINWYVHPPLSLRRHPWKWYSLHRRMRKVRRKLRDRGYDVRRGHHRTPC